MDSHRLEVFLAAAQEGSLSRAAARLGCTQSAVTQAMNGLEAELGCRLLERGHGGVRLTEEGRSLLPVAQSVLAGVNRLFDEASAFGSRRRPPLRIGCFASVLTTWLPSAMTAYRAQGQPEATFDVRVGTNSLADDLLVGRCDLAIADVDWLGAFAREPLMRDSYLAVVPARYLDEYPDLGENGRITRERLLGLPSAMAPMNGLERHFERGSGWPVHVACDDDSTLIALVARGLGVAVVPGLSLRDVPSSVRVFELDPPTVRTIGVALPAVPTEAARDFTRFLVERFDAGDAH
jgi:DNA-binding transcriptional LysR family regulator